MTSPFMPSAVPTSGISSILKKIIRTHGSLRLEQNYRSTQNILDAAWGVVHNNRSRKAKKLWTENDYGELITCYEAMDESDEAGYVGTQIEDWHSEGVDYKDFAVFYRTNAQSRILRKHSALQTSPIRLSEGSVSMIGWRLKISLPTSVCFAIPMTL